MPTYTFLPGGANFNEVQALYTGLFDAPQSSNSGGLLYWENYLASNNAGALNAISGYATYNGQTISSSNIGSEINNIYEHLYRRARKQQRQRILGKPVDGRRRDDVHRADSGGDL